jgi:hypothetical protein
MGYTQAIWATLTYIHIYSNTYHGLINNDTMKMTSPDNFKESIQWCTSYFSPQSQPIHYVLGASKPLNNMFAILLSVSGL